MLLKFKVLFHRRGAEISAEKAQSVFRRDSLRFLCVSAVNFFNNTELRHYQVNLILVYFISFVVKYFLVFFLNTRSVYHSTLLRQSTLNYFQPLFYVRIFYENTALSMHYFVALNGYLRRFLSGEIRKHARRE